MQRVTQAEIYAVFQKVAIVDATAKTAVETEYAAVPKAIEVFKDMFMEDQYGVLQAGPLVECKNPDDLYRHCIAENLEKGRKGRFQQDCVEEWEVEKWCKENKDFIDEVGQEQLLGLSLEDQWRIISEGFAIEQMDPAHIIEERADRSKEMPKTVKAMFSRRVEIPEEFDSESSLGGLSDQQTNLPRQIRKVLEVEFSQGELIEQSNVVILGSSQGGPTQSNVEILGSSQGGPAAQEDTGSSQGGPVNEEDTGSSQGGPVDADALESARADQ